MLLTNDGELTWRLTHPSQEIRKEYLVTLQGRLTPEATDLVRKGLYLAEPGAGGKTRRAHVEDLRVLRQRQDRSQGDQSLVSVTLAEGQNREIRRLFARVGLKVRRLQRQAIGPVRLGHLPEGRFRRLTGAEIAALRRATGLDPGGSQPL